MTARAITFDDFSRGEYGTLGPSLPPGVGPGWFTGKNVMVYANGSVGPRPGVRTVTRLGTWPDGIVRVLFPSTNASQSTFTQIGEHGRQFTTDLTALELTVTHEFNDDPIPEPTTYPNNGQHRGLGNWVIVPGDGLYRAKIDDDTVILADGAMNGRVMRFYRDRQLAAANSDEVWFSDPGPDGWDTFEDFFNGTSFNPVSAFLELRNGVLIPQATPNLDLVTGTIGTSSSVLRRVSSRAAPTDPYGCASIGSEFVVMMGRGFTYPMLYNGAAWEELRHLAYAGDDARATSADNGAVPAHTVIDLEFDDSWMILSGLDGDDSANRMLLAWGGARTYHTWETSIAPFARRFNEGVIMLTDGGSATDPPEFYTWFPDLDRPGFVSDPFSQPGDDSDSPLDAYMHTPAWVAEDGQEILLRGAVIEFTKWNTGAAETNHFSVTVDARRRYSAAGPVTSTPQVFDEAGSAATTAGVDAAVHLHFGNQGWATECQVKIDELRGCAIRRITPILEQRPERI